MYSKGWRRNLRFVSSRLGLIDPVQLEKCPIWCLEWILVYANHHLSFFIFMTVLTALFKAFSFKSLLNFFEYTNSRLWKYSILSKLLCLERRKISKRTTMPFAVRTVEWRICGALPKPSYLTNLTSESFRNKKEAEE